MELNAGSQHHEMKTFTVFRHYYNYQIRKQLDCFAAFEVASVLFFKEHGFYLFRSLDEYLHELFKVHNGYKLLDDPE